MGGPATVGPSEIFKHYFLEFLIEHEFYPYFLGKELSYSEQRD